MFIAKRHSFMCRYSVRRARTLSIPMKAAIFIPMYEATRGPIFLVTAPERKDGGSKRGERRTVFCARSALNAAHDKLRTLPPHKTCHAGSTVIQHAPTRRRRGSGRFNTPFRSKWHRNAPNLLESARIGAIVHAFGAGRGSSREPFFPFAAAINAKVRLARWSGPSTGLAPLFFDRQGAKPPRREEDVVGQVFNLSVPHRTG